jgi:hypothetical protein
VERALFYVGSALFLLAAITAIGHTQTQRVSGQDAEAIANLLRTTPRIGVATASATPAGNCRSSNLSDGSKLVTQTVDAKKPVYDPIAANSQSSVLWPGALVQVGKLEESGIINGIPVPRTGGTVYVNSLAATIDPATGHGVVVKADIPQLSGSAVETERINLLGNPNVVGTGQFTAGFASFSSLDELAFRFNGSASAFGSSFQVQLRSAEYQQTNNEAILFYQPIYTYTIDDFSGPAAFASGVTVNALAPYTGPTNPIGYISSVTYGRMAVMTFSSSIGKSELDTLVRASAGFLVGQASAENERQIRRAVTQTTVHLWIYGFPLTVDAINNAPDKVAALKAAMADSGPLVLRSAQPILYRVNYLFDDTAAAINLSTRFDSSTRSGPPLVDSIKVHFTMGSESGDNKDWDTALGIYLLDRVNGVREALSSLSSPSTHLRALASVPKGVNGEGSWQSGRDDIEVPLTIQGTLKWSELNNLSVLIVENSNGADHIGFTPTVIATGPGDTIYRSRLQAFSIPSGSVPGFPVLFPGDFGQVTTAPPTLPTPTCDAPANFLRNSRTASVR